MESANWSTGTVSGIKILIVDDDELGLEYKGMFISIFLKLCNDVVILRAGSYIQAVQYIDADTPDILISDLNLESKETGLDICKYLKLKNSRSICAICSGIYGRELKKIKTENALYVDEVFSDSVNMNDLMTRVFQIWTTSRC